MLNEGFFSSEVALYLHKSTRLPCMENCCHVLVLPVAAWTCWMMYRNGYVGLLVLDLLTLLNSLLIAEMWEAEAFSMGMTLEVYLI